MNFNEITGDTLINKVPTEEYKMNHDIVFAKQLMVDPPSGWKYGFPAVWNKRKFGTLAMFLLSKGYPESDVEFALNHCRMWIPTAEDEST